MNFRILGKFLSKVLLIEAIFMIPALLISTFQGEMDSVLGFAASICIILLLSFLLGFATKGGMRSYFAKEGLMCVGISWLALSVMGCFPFWISGGIPSFIDALFETVSGFTTTGSSILSEVESLPMGLLYWRSFTHWIGGMGVLVFVLALGTGSEGKTGFTMHVLRAESPGPSVGKLVPKMKSTAEILYGIYLALTVIDIIFLLAGGMPLFDAVCTAFGTAGTGGFGIRNDSIAGYSPYIQNVCTVFMLLFGVNFTCYYMLLIRQVKSIYKDEELRAYLGIVFASIVLIVWNLKDFYGSFEETVRHAAFQVSSIMTTTGFATTDFDQWPSFSKAILFALMMIGASAGSTGGGFKVGRLLLILKSIRRNVRQVMNPKKVQVVKMNGAMVGEKVLENSNAYLAVYAMIIGASFLVISLDGFSITTNLSAVVACFNNIGPGFEMVGATGNFGAYSVLSKLVLILDMLAGRLEIFPILILFSRSAWKNK